MVGSGIGTRLMAARNVLSIVEACTDIQSATTEDFKYVFNVAQANKKPLLPAGKYLAGKLDAVYPACTNKIQ